MRYRCSPGVLPLVLYIVDIHFPELVNCVRLHSFSKTPVHSGMGSCLNFRFARGGTLEDLQVLPC
jgi:hypothetical protein